MGGIEGFFAVEWHSHVWILGISALPLLWNLYKMRGGEVVEWLEAGDLVRSHSSNPGKNYWPDREDQNVVPGLLLDGEGGRGMPQELVPNSCIGHMDGIQHHSLKSDHQRSKNLGVGMWSSVSYLLHWRCGLVIQWTIDPGFSVFSMASPTSQETISLGQTNTVGQLAVACEFERARLGHKYKHCRK